MEQRRAACGCRCCSSPKPCVLLTFYPPPDQAPALLDGLQQRFTVIPYFAIPKHVETKPGESSWEFTLASPEASCIRAMVAYRPPESLIDALPKLALVACIAAGVDGVDLDACRVRGISVTNVPSASSDDVADLALALGLAARRHLCSSDQLLRRKGLVFDPPLGRKVSGQRVGIVGLGSIGRAIAKRVEAFGCTVSYYGRTQKEGVPFPFYRNVVDLAGNSDILFIACSLTEETRHLIGREVLDALGACGTLVNVARGAVLNETELVAALQESRLGSAGLDVFEREPNVPEALLRLDNVVLVPHIGSSIAETREEVARVLIANLEAFFAGKALVSPVRL